MRMAWQRVKPWRVLEQYVAVGHSGDVQMKVTQPENHQMRVVVPEKAMRMM
jgi:hypothetical protein